MHRDLNPAAPKTVWSIAVDAKFSPHKKRGKYINDHRKLVAVALARGTERKARQLDDRRKRFNNTAKYQREWQAKNKEKTKEYQRRWYEKNKEKKKAAVMAWRNATPENQQRHRDALKKSYAKHRDKRLAEMRAWYRKNSARAYLAIREWCKKNPTRVKAYHAKREARKRNATGSCTPEQLQARFDFYGGLCAYCGKPATTVDHVVPLERGGSNWPANLRPACRSCNSSKKDKLLGKEWTPPNASAVI